MTGIPKDWTGGLLLGVWIGAAIQAVVGTIFDRTDRAEGFDRIDRERPSLASDLQERALVYALGYAPFYALVVLGVVGVIEWLT